MNPKTVFICPISRICIGPKILSDHPIGPIDINLSLKISVGQEGFSGLWNVMPELQHDTNKEK